MQRTRLAINAGNFLELLGAVCGVYGIFRLAGLAWALIALAILLVVAAELVYDAHVWRVPLPRRPHPRRWIEERKQALQISRLRYRRRLRAWWVDRRLSR